MKNPWVLASRPKTLPAAIAPVLLGVALAIHDSSFRPIVAIITMLAALLIQIGTNFANDLFDFLKGADTADRIGPVRATQSGLLSPKKIRTGTIVVFGLAVCCGFYLAFIGGFPIVIIGLASIAAGIAYTGGPYPFGYHGWGDVFVFIFFGLIAVTGTYYLQTGSVNTESVLIGSAMGALSTAILIVNNLRDTKTDAKTGKRTLSVRFGKTFVRIEYTVIIIFSYIIPLWLSFWWSNDLALYLTLFSLPIAVKLSIAIWSLDGFDLNPILGGTARLLLIYSILFSLGLIL